MDFRKILKSASHTREVIIREGAIEELPAVLGRLFPASGKVVIVADPNTWRAAGERVGSVLRACGIALDRPLIIDDPALHAEWGFVEMVEAHLASCPEAVPVAVGSGVINDLVKLSSAHLGRRYVVVGTAASMDGYVAYGASITFEGIKQTFDCPAPLALLMDPGVAAAAPAGLSASGYADLYAKVPAGAEWIIADALGEDTIHQKAWHCVQDGLGEALSRPAQTALGDVSATSLLCEGLVMSGLAMQACRSSRPASGIEHQFSHFWDMEGHTFQGHHVSHGFQVAIGTLVSTACLEYLCSCDLEHLDIDAAVAAWPSWEQQSARIRQLLSSRSVHCARALSESLAKYKDAPAIRAQLERLVSIWPSLRNSILGRIRPLQIVREDFRLAGAPYEPEMIGISRAKLRETFLAIPYMRSRFTGIDVILRAGLMERVTDYLFGPGGPWEA